jgi:hypothetical protein
LGFILQIYEKIRFLPLFINKNAYQYQDTSNNPAIFEKDNEKYPLQ